MENECKRYSLVLYLFVIHEISSLLPYGLIFMVSQKPYLTSIESPHFLLCFGMGFGGLKGALASLLAARATCALFTLLNGSSHRERALLGSWVRCHVPLLLLITLLTRIIHHLSLHVMPRAPPSLRHHPLGQKHPPTHCQ